MKRLIVTMLMACALSGCITMGGAWYNTDPNVTTEQFQRDKAECSMRADSATASDPNPFSPLYGYQVIFPECMRAKGYTQGSKS